MPGVSWGVFDPFLGGHFSGLSRSIFTQKKRACVARLLMLTVSDRKLRYS
jgi:hypothetical protein